MLVAPSTKKFGSIRRNQIRNSNDCLRLLLFGSKVVKASRPGRKLELVKTSKSLLIVSLAVVYENGT